jgi:anaerobic selenocysteine-containing dehydrogenase
MIKNTTTNINTGIEIKTTTCYMCACHCGRKVTTKDGEVFYIQGNPDHPLNKDALCAKGASGIMKQYSLAHLTKPLLRRNKGTMLLLAAILIQYVELITERWYFFADANHPQNLY